MIKSSLVSEFVHVRQKSGIFAQRARVLPLAVALAGAFACATPLSAFAAPAANTQAAQQSGLKFEVDSEGIKNLSYNGISFIVNDNTQTSVKIVSANGTLVDVNGGPSKTFDAATSTETARYPWGRALYHYSQVGNRLNVSTTLVNESQQTIGYAFVRPISINVAGGLKDITVPSVPRNVDDYGIIRRNFGNSQKGGSIFAVTQDADPSLSFQGFAFVTAPKRASDNVHADNADITPGKSKTYNYSLFFEPQSRSYQDFAQTLYATRASVVPTLINWNDRRPIGSIFMANSNQQWPKNPRGWFNDVKVDVTTPAGKAAFKQRALSFADSCVRNLKNVGAQGMIFWDVEGEEMPHAITYLGDPRVLPAAAPEMDEIADQFFAKFREAGLKTGVTLRPSRVVIDPKTNKWRHNHMNFDVVNELSEKIDYAQKRWGSTIFYVDSNATYAFTDKGDVTAWTMRADMFRQLQSLHPDCLLIPEHHTFDYWSATAPYQELRSNNFGTPDLARVAFKKAFSVINIADGDLNRHHNALVQDIKNGDVLLFRCWFDDKTHTPVKNLYEEAKGKEDPAPAPKPAPEPEPAPEPNLGKEIIVDNLDAGAFFEDAWKTSGASTGFYSKDYYHDGNSKKGSKSVRFRPELPQAGTWEVFARWSSYNNRATNAPYDVVSAKDTPFTVSATIICNQQQNGGEWVSLGRYKFNAGNQGSVLLRNDNTDGYVIADAVKWVFVGSDAPTSTPTEAAAKSNTDPTAPSAQTS